ncbi:MAG: glycosyltransferase family 4 protein [Candidatus Riflebacteria bacterium]|nr:glycosyltransferase family 4 protein [Candidatus Riflebacteria bacterium]
MRIFVNASSAVSGGGVTYLKELIRWLPALAPGDEFLFAVPETWPASPQPSNSRLLPIAPVGQGAWRRFLWENGELKDQVTKAGADLLFCPANVVPFLVPPVPLVVMLQNVAPFYPRVRRLVARYEGRGAALRQLLLEGLSVRAVRRADLVLFLSESSRRLLERREGRLAHRVIPHGRPADFGPGRPRPADAPTGPYLLFVSNFYVYKGLEYLVEALQADPGLPPVVAVGEPFEAGFFRFLQERIRAAGVEGRIRFVGSVPHADLAGWYAHARALVFPSWCESFGMTPLEAMSCGCPVVAWRSGPVPEVCGDAAWYAGFPDIVSLGEALRQAVAAGDDPLCRARAQARAAGFSWPGTMRLHLEAFRGVLAAGR